MPNKNPKTNGEIPPNQRMEQVEKRDAGNRLNIAFTNGRSPSTNGVPVEKMCKKGSC